MTPIRWILVATVLGGVAFDLARKGSEEYACKSEIARAEQEIAILRQRRDDLQVGIQQRLLAHIPISGVTSREAIVSVDLPRQRTLWERSNSEDADLQRAFASENADARRLSLGDWLAAQ